MEKTDRKLLKFIEERIKPYETQLRSKHRQVNKLNLRIEDLQEQMRLLKKRYAGIESAFQRQGENRRKELNRLKAAEDLIKSMSEKN